MLKLAFFCVSLFFPIHLVVLSNPFIIDFEKKEISSEDYNNISEILQKKNIHKTIDLWIQENQHELIKDKTAFHKRLTRGIYWNFHETENNYEIKIEKIGNGSENCIVSLCTFQANYPRLLEQQIKSIKDSGFNGYHVSFWGVYPNPTGKEIKYIGIPYSFKMNAILYAKKLGFQNVLWLDSSVSCLKNPTPLFEFIRKNDLYFQFYRHQPKEYRQPQILDVARESIIDILGVDIFDFFLISKRFVWAIVFGFNVESEKFNNFYLDYENLLNRGTPFASTTPEETVFSAILFKKNFRNSAENANFFDKKKFLVYSSVGFNSYSDINKSLFIWLDHPHPKNKLPEK